MKTQLDIARERALVDVHGDVVINKAVPNFEPSFFYGAYQMSQSQSSGMDERKPYNSHSTVYACAHKIATQLKRVPHKISKRAGENDEETHIYKHPVLKSLSSPNPWQSRTTFWEAIVLALMLPTPRSTGGQVFLIPSTLSGKKVNLRKGEIPSCWFPYDDTWVSAVMKDGEFVNWRWRLPGRNTSDDVGAIFYEPEELIRIYNYNPYDPLHGLAPYVPVSMSVKSDSEASRFNYNFFKNNCMLTGVLTTEGTITPQQRVESLKAWNELYAGSNKAGGVALLGNGLKYVELSQKHLDMQFAEMKKINKYEVIAAYGLNELAFDIGSIPYANVVEGQKMLWYDTYMPVEDHIMESITEQWVQYVDPTLAIEADYSELPALKADLGAKVIVAAQLITQCQTPIAEAFRLAGIDIDAKQYPWMLTKPVIATASPFGQATPPTPEPEKVIVPETKEMPDEVHKARNLKISESHCKMTLAPGEKRMYKMFSSYFSQQRNQVLDNVDKWSGELPYDSDQQKEFVFKDKFDGVINKVTAKDILFDLKGENKKLFDKYKPLVKEQMKQTSESLGNENINWAVTDDSVQAFAALRKDIVEGINSTTFDMAGDTISDVIADSLDEGLTIKETADAIKSKVQELYDVRLTNANTIARTETGSITNMARLEAFKEEGVEFWEWVTSKDDNVRDEHRIDGEIVRVGEPFSNGLKMPLDPDGSPDLICNCRCVTVWAENPGKGE
jgi:SPP1 gp7 family putative phage head morphogenesis protein